MGCCRNILTITLLMTTGGFLHQAKAQDESTRDSLQIIADSLVVRDMLDNAAARMEIGATSDFRPVPKRAVICSAIFPGLGQIYNRKYWKLPLVYGGFMGFIYAVSWNNKNYRDYADAYLYITNDAKEFPDAPEMWDDSWQSFVPAGRDPADYLNDSSFKSRLKNGKDFYRRYRDLSIILTVAWYLICMADSYVDAQLFDFDISDNLALRIAPVVSPRTAYSSGLYGISCSFNF